MMDARAQSLLVKLQSFSLDEPGAPRPFSARLREENGWTEGFTRRSIDEYRRFLVLAALAGHRVSPSPIVDEVWHLHLLYTRSYWDELCGKVLGFPLHHEPSRGRTDNTALAADYMRTLSSYERLFGEAPPPDVWPSPNKKQPSRHRKPTFQMHSVFFGLAAITTPFSLPMAADLPGPLSMSGPAFLLLYLFAAPASALLAVGMRRVLLGSLSQVPLLPQPLVPIEVAYLRGGALHAVDVALVDLIGQRQIVFSAATNRIELDASGPPLEEAIYRVAARPAEPSAFERAILNRVGSGITLAKLRLDASEDAKALLGAKLINAGLVAGNQRAKIAFWLPLAAALFFLIIGVVRIFMGFVYDRPVGVLVFLTIIWGFMLYAFFRNSLFTRPSLTAQGTARLTSLLTQHKTLFREPIPDNLPLAAALFGKDVLWVGSLLDPVVALRPTDGSSDPNSRDTNGANGGAIGSCGGAGGGGCGGGGCGGGGCGGGE